MRQNSVASELVLALGPPSHKHTTTTYMVDVRRPYHTEQLGPRGGPTLMHAPGMAERGWMNGPAGYPGMTKEYAGAAVPSHHNNSGPARSHLPYFVDRDTIYATGPVSGGF